MIATPSRVVIHVPRLRTSGPNAREHFMVRAKRVRRERAQVFGAIQLYQLAGGGFNPLPSLPVHVHLVRESPGTRPPDSDNIHGYLKSARDQIAASYGVDDGPAGPITWTCASERGEDHGVRIEIEAR